MTWRRTTAWALAGAVGLLTALPALAAAPELAVYVTDADEDVFVGLYGDQAVELAGCPGPPEARALLQLAADTEPRETTLAELETGFALGRHPSLPCGPDAAFDRDWPATAPVWADLEGSGSYFLRAPDGGAEFYAVPSRCEGLKTGLALRERLQLPGVLQAMTAPDDLVLRLTLDCGDTMVGDGDVEPFRPESSLSLHTFDTFLTADSTGDTIYVARYLPAGESGSPAYLPIWRLDGKAVAEMTLAGGAAAEEAEAALKRVLGLPAEAAVERLTAEAVTAVRSAAHADLCTTDCDGYAHRHAAFLDPADDLALTALPPAAASRQLGRRGQEQLVWPFAGERRAVFTDCAQLAGALGLEAPEIDDWLASVDAALRSPATAGTELVCQPGPAELCVRRLDEGAPLDASVFAPGVDCPGARRLRVELPASVRAPGPLTLTGDAFESVAVGPLAGVTRSVVTATPGPSAGPVSCGLATGEAILFADRLPRLEIRDLALRRAAGAGSGEVIGLQVAAGGLVLDGVTVGGEAEGAEPLARGVSLCLADLYAADSDVRATSLGVQGVSARLLITGEAESPAAIVGPRFGVLMSADSAVRLDHARIEARSPIVLRSGRMVATQSALVPGAGFVNGSSALQLGRGTAAELTTCTLAGFRCVASFLSPDSEARFVLPGNDLAADNTHLQCGEQGLFSLLE